MVGSLVVASLIVSQVMATEFRMEEADDMSPLLRLDEYAADDRSWCRMPVRSGCWYRSSVGGLVDSPMVATSSGRCSFSGLLGPFGWRDTASAALCLTPGTCTILNLYRRVFSLRLRNANWKFCLGSGR